MKKVFALFFALTLLVSFGAFSQTVTIGNPSGPSPQYVPITFDVGSNTITAFDLVIEHDSSISFDEILDVVGLTPSQVAFSYPYSAIGIADPSRTILVSWPETSGSFTGSDVVVNLRFSGPLGSTPLTFLYVNDAVEPGSKLETASGILTSTFTPGSVTFTAPVPLSNWAIFIGLGLIIAFLVVRFRRIV